MKLHGYAKTPLQGPEPKLLTLQEVTLSVTPDELRNLAAFLLHAATQIEAHGLAFEHAHYADFMANAGAEVDLIVFNAAVQR